MKNTMKLVLILILNYIIITDQTGNEVTAPQIFSSEKRCGVMTILPTFWANFNNHDVDMYHLNETADRLSSEGFEIDFGVTLEDALVNFTASNASHAEYFELGDVSGVSNDVRDPTSLIKSFYMAHFGKKIGDAVTWLCEGALINRQWILTVAGCFDEKREQGFPTFVRVGEFDLEAEVADGIRVSLDSEFAKPILHPTFKSGSPIADLALVKLPKETHFFTSTINPVCLPWDSETNRNLTDAKVVLTSWALSETEAPLSTTLQEMEMVVAGSEECGQQYADFFGLDSVLPEGTGHGNVLCAKPDPPKTYKCSESSAGSPIVYQGTEGFGLAGISSSKGCGSSDRPVFFCPVNNADTLQWIKDTAFVE